jgi:hypothetical protein
LDDYVDLIRTHENNVQDFWITAGLLIVSASLSAHHGNAANDTAKVITTKATITEWQWLNPHCWLKFDIKDEKGNVTHWTASYVNSRGRHKGGDGGLQASNFRARGGNKQDTVSPRHTEAEALALSAAQHYPIWEGNSSAL